MEFSKRNQRFFNLAIVVAQSSRFHPFKVGAVVVGDKGVVSVGVNSLTRTHPLQKKFNIHRHFQNTNGEVFPCIHAEIDALSKAKRIHEYKTLSIYVARVKHDKSVGLARPCPACMSALLEYNIVDVYYTTDNGLAYEQINQ